MAENTSPSFARHDADDPEITGKRLIVGRGISMSGEINACDRLVVEGFVKATLNDTKALEIADGGRFDGSCEVESAEISGSFEGDLTVRGRLLIRGTGKFTGSLRYGELEVERGGQIAGQVNLLGGSDLAGKSAAAQARPNGGPAAYAAHPLDDEDDDGKPKGRFGPAPSKGPEGLGAARIAKG